MEHPPLRTRFAPILLKQLQKKGDHHISVLATLAVLDMDLHPVAADVPDLPVGHLQGVQTNAAVDAQGCPIPMPGPGVAARSAEISSALSMIGSLRGSARDRTYLLMSLRPHVI